MTFTDFKSYVDWLVETSEVTVQETNAPGDKDKYVTIEDIDNTDPMAITEALVSAYDSGFYVGALFSGKYDGMVTIRP